MTMTQALCGEHGLPLSQTSRGIACPQGCELTWAEVSADDGSVVVVNGALYVQ